MRRPRDEELGGEQDDDEPDVWGDQSPVDWGKQPISDEGFTPEAREQLSR